MSNDNWNSLNSLAKELEEICESDEQFSLGSLQEVINRIPPDVSQLLEQHQSNKYLDCYFDFLPRSRLTIIFSAIRRPRPN